MVKEMLSRFSHCSLEDMQKMEKVFSFFKSFSEKMKKEITNMVTVFA